MIFLTASVPYLYHYTSSLTVFDSMQLQNAVFATDENHRRASTIARTTEMDKWHVVTFVLAAAASQGRLSASQIATLLMPR